MRSKHIAFFSFPHTPHVNPVLPIVAALIRRGHRVTYVTSEVFASRVAALGAQIVGCPSFIEISTSGQARFQNTFALSDSVIESATAVYAQTRPDLILYDRAFFAGRVLATRMHVPAATTSPALSFNKATVELLSDSLRTWRDKEIQFTKEVDAFYLRHGMQEKNSYFHDEPLNIYLYPKLYQLSGELFDERYFYAGRCPAERPHSGAWRPGAERRPTILVSASTAYVPGPDYFRMCIDAFAGLKCHILLAVSGNFALEMLSPLPAHCEVIQQHVPQIQVLPHVDLLVCMGGPVSAAEAMYHGVPLLMTTHGSQDAEVYAENGVRLGIGLHLRKPETTAETIRDAALSILGDATFAARMQEVSRIVKREPGGEDTANRIEEYLQETMN